MEAGICKEHILGVLCISVSQNYITLTTLVRNYIITHVGVYIVYTIHYIILRAG
jgi:hypothetical protein